MKHEIKTVKMRDGKTALAHQFITKGGNLYPIKFPNYTTAINKAKELGPNWEAVKSSAGITVEKK